MPDTEDAKQKEELMRIEDRLAAGEIVQVDPEVADMLGVHEEDALSEEDALEARPKPEEDSGRRRE